MTARIAILAVFSILVASQLLRGQEKEVIPHSPTDEWAGKTVADGEHVKGMIYARLLQAPKIGSKAPVTLVTDANSGKPTLLSDLYASKPVVLFFASYSCLCSQEVAEFMNKFDVEYRKDFQFVLIYIREAHPVGGFATKIEGKEFSIPDPKNFIERATAALKFAAERGIQFPILVDSMEDTQAVQWAAWPSRIYVIDRAGTIAFAGQQGPWFVKPTASFDLKLPGVPEGLRDIEGYRRESLDDFLKASRRSTTLHFNR